MRTDVFQFVVRNAIADTLKTSNSRQDFIKAVTGGSESYDWGQIAFDLDLIKQQYEIVAFEDIPLTMLYWPSYEEGLANVIAQMSLAPLSDDETFSEVIRIMNLDFKEYVSGKGRWCYWGEELVTFYPSFRELAEAWLGGDSIEPDLENTRLLLQQVGTAKAEKAAKELASKKGSQPYDTLEEFLIAVDKS
jgi:hypothetical protein